jgi:hypothetical protein
VQGERLLISSYGTVVEVVGLFTSGGRWAEGDRVVPARPETRPPCVALEPLVVNLPTRVFALV